MNAKNSARWSLLCGLVLVSLLFSACNSWCAAGHATQTAVSLTQTERRRCSCPGHTCRAFGGECGVSRTCKARLTCGSCPRSVTGSVGVPLSLRRRPELRA